jgi:hypothetical protein
MSPVAVRIVAILVAAFAALLARPAVAAGGCASPPPIWINLSLPSPVLDNSRTRAEIQQKAPQSHGGHTVGLYVGTLKTSVQVGFQIVSRAGQSCVAVSVVTVNLGVADRHIYLAHEWPPGSCPYRAILDHERKHQAADDKALRGAAQAIRDEIAKTVASIGSLVVPPSGAKAAQQRLNDAVTGAYRMGTARLLLDQGRRQQAVDAGFEYARLTASCSEFGNGYTPYTPLPPKGADQPLLPGLR